MGRPSVMNRDKKVNFSVSVERSLLKRIDECRNQHTRSDFVAKLIQNQLFSDKAFASYMWRQKQLEANYWEYEFKKADGKNALIKASKDLTMADFLREQ